VRSLFTRESLLASRWYADRLQAQQENDVASGSGTEVPGEFLAKRNYDDETLRLRQSAKAAPGTPEARGMAPRAISKVFASTIGAHPWR
jgi:hypothetical protein